MTEIQVTKVVESSLDKDIKLENMISQVYIYELLLKSHGITLKEAEKPVKSLTPKEIQKSLITGKTQKNYSFDYTSVSEKGDCYKRSLLWRLFNILV